jgi:hypothetical protein
MFTWICPQCGGEVPPSMDACPRCTPPTIDAFSQVPEREPAVPPVLLPVQPAHASTPPVAPVPAVQPAPAPTVPGYQTPPPVQPVQPFNYPYAEPAPPKAINPILVVSAVAALLLGAGYVAFQYLPSSKLEQTGETQPGEKAKLLDAKGASVHPLAKHIEVTGFRIREDKNQRVTVQMVIVNHSGADIAGLEMQVGLYVKGDLLVEFPVKVKSLGPFEVAQGNGQATTKLRPYEFPDWQFLTPKVTITAP